jgi:hypothetical protein
MTRRRTVVFAGGALVLIIGIGVVLWVMLQPGPFSSGTSQADTQEAATVAAELPKNRAAAIDPGLTDDPQAIPVYPPETKIELDKTSWLLFGESASAFATITPQNQRVTVYFGRVDGHWRITQIEAQ